MAAELDPTALRVALPATRIPLRLEEVVMAAAMAGIALITGANVLTRYVSDVSLAFTEEYSVVLMVLVTLVGSAYAARRAVISASIFLVERLPAHTRRWAELGALAATVLCFALVAGYGVQLAFDDYRFEVLSPGLGHPQWLYTAMLPVFSAVIVARTAGRFVRVARGQS